MKLGAVFRRGFFEAGWEAETNRIATMEFK